MNAEMTQRLRDIQDLDPVSWWPPAPGWWLLAGLALLLLLFLVLAIRNLRHYPAGSWRRHAWKQLRMLRQQAHRMPAQELAIELSELLRRIAVARIGRTQAAGLSGQRWLDWLHANDPAGFDWRERGRLLLSLPYAPPGDEQVRNTQLIPLIDATFAWVDRRAGRRHA